METPGIDQREKPGPTCNVSSKLNYTAGVVAVLAGLAIGYCVWRWAG